jgi:hypothetical protein
MELFNKFRNEVNTRNNQILNDRLSRIDRLSSKGKIDKANGLQVKFASQDAKSGSDMSVLNSTLQELSLLKSSSQVYDLYENSSDVPTTADGITTYDTGTNAVNMSSRGGFSVGVFAHELKHAYQFETGNLFFWPSGKTGGVLYDLTDEYEAFSRGSFFIGLNLSHCEINSEYPGRPQGSINLNTLQNGGSATYGSQIKR